MCNILLARHGCIYRDNKLLISSSGPAFCKARAPQVEKVLVMTNGDDDVVVEVVVEESAVVVLERLVAV